MKLHTRFLSVSLSALVLGPAALAQRPTITVTDTAPFGLFGAQMEQIGDINGDGVPDFVIAAPSKNVGMIGGSPLSGVAAGQISAVLGGDTRATPIGITAGAWQVNGAGGWSPCSGGSGNVGSNLGASMTVIGDRNGDGVNEVVVGAPFFSTTNAVGTCLAADLGQVQTLNGANGLPLNVSNGAGQNARYGRIVVTLTDFISQTTGLPDGQPEYLVVGNGFADIRDGASDTIICPNIPVSIPGSVACAAGDFDQDGVAMDIAFPSAGGISIFDLAAVRTIATITGPAASAFGAALEFVPAVPSVPGGPNGPSGVLIGAPGDIAGDGGVYFAASQSLTFSGMPAVLPSSLVFQGQAGAGLGLGASLDFGGDADGDGGFNDIVIGSSNGFSMAFASLTGQDFGTADRSLFGMSGANVVRWAGNVVAVGGAPAPVGGAFTQVLAGFSSSSTGAGQVDLLAGGPENNAPITIVNGCNPSLGPVPTLTQFDTVAGATNFSPGASPQFTISGAPAGQLASVLVGLPSATPIPFDADLTANVFNCQLGVGLVISSFNGTTTSLGGPPNSDFFATPGIPIPNATLLGVTLAVQGLISDVPNAQILTTRAVTVTVGW